MGFDGIGQLVMLFVGAQTVFDDLAIGAVLFQLRSAVGERRGAPEIGVDRLALADHLVLFEQLGEQDIERADRSEEHTSELQSLMRISYAVFCLKKKNKIIRRTSTSCTPPIHSTLPKSHTYHHL